MGLQETGELDLDLILFGDPGDDSSEPDEIICGCGHGRGRVETRTVPRLPQAAILHRISLMELRDTNPSTSATGVRRGRGRARILRENATSNLPTVGKLQRKEEIPEPAQQKLEEPRPKQTDAMPVKMSSNWLHDEFPTLSAAHQDTDSDSSSKAGRHRRKKPSFQEIRAKVDKLKPRLTNDISEIENNQKHFDVVPTEDPAVKLDEIHPPVNTLNPEVVDLYNITKEENENNGLKAYNSNKDVPEPKINQKNFMKQSKLDFLKLLPDGYNKYNNYSKRNHQERKRDMDRFVLNEDLPEYCKYEVTHEDIRKHNKKAAKVPDTVKGKVNDWLNKVHVNHIEEVKKLEHSGETGVRNTSDLAVTVITEDTGKSCQSSTEFDTLNSVRLENGYPEYVQVTSGRNMSHENYEDSKIFSESLILEHDSNIMKVENIEGGTVAADTEGLSQTNEESQVFQNSSVKGKSAIAVTEHLGDNKTNSAAADLYIDNENLCDKLIEEIDAMELSEVEISESNNLDIDTDSEHIYQDAFQMNSSNIYVSDEESNMLLENTRAVADNHTNLEQSSVVSTDSNKACISESDFVVKYETRNEKKTGKEKSTLRRDVMSDEIPANIWRLDGERVIQFDGLSANCVTSHLEEVISNFGTVSDSERKVFGDRLSIRFKQLISSPIQKYRQSCCCHPAVGVCILVLMFLVQVFSVMGRLHDEDACDFAVQCLHDTDCLFPDSNSVLECFKVG